MDQIKIVAVVGSLRRESYNRQLALAAKEMLKGKADFEILEYQDIPFMNQDIEFPAPDSIKRVRAQVKAADGLWFFSPEYNHFFPGVLKNLIDWLSRPLSQTEPHILGGKPAAFSGVTIGIAGTRLAQDHLVALISLLNMDVMNAPRLTIPNALGMLDEQGRLDLSSSLCYLEEQAAAFLEFIARRKAL